MADYLLYQGEVLLVFDENEHKYTYNGNVVTGVTSVTDIVDKSNALIPWALNQAEKYLKANWPIDSYVSTAMLDSLCQGMKSAHRRIKYRAANLGTQAHEWIEGHIKSSVLFEEDPPLPSDPQVLNAVLQYLEFEKQHHIVYISSERKVYSIQYDYAGTLDILALVDGVLTLLDIKTSNAFRSEYAMQSAAYVKAVNEEDEIDIKERIILMLSKDESKFTPITLPSSDLDNDFNAFLSALNLYRWNKGYKKPKKNKKLTEGENDTD